MRHRRSRPGLSSRLVRAILVCLLPAGVLLGCLMTACVSDPFVELGKVSHEVDPTQPVTDLHVRLLAGSIRVVRSPDERIGIDATVLVPESWAKDHAEPLRFDDHVRLEQRSGVVEVSSVHDDQPDHGSWRLNLVVAIPGNPAVDVDLEAGKLEVQLPVARSLNANVSAGSVDAHLEKIVERADVLVDAGRAEVEITDSAPAEGVSVRVASGEAVLTLPPDTEGVFDLSTDAGAVTTAPRYGLRAERSVVSASASGTVGSGQARFVVHSDAGRVELR